MIVKVVGRKLIAVRAHELAIRIMSGVNQPSFAAGVPSSVAAASAAANCAGVPRAYIAPQAFRPKRG